MKRLPRTALALILLLLLATGCSSGYKPVTEEKFMEVAASNGYGNAIGETVDDFIASLRLLGVEDAVLMVKIDAADPSGGSAPSLPSSQLYYLRLEPDANFRALVDRQLEEGLLKDFFEEDLEVGKNHVFTSAVRGDSRFLLSMVDNVVLILDTNDEEKETAVLREMGHPSAPDRK